ncbi:MAG: hypothetical protein M3P83_04565 [Actinomycetota bacterium]|nr:hypothetical protein [Actinomycetota bacterium]
MASRQLPVQERAWIAARPLEELRLLEEGVVALGFSEPRGSIGAPALDPPPVHRDVAVLYGR